MGVSSAVAQAHLSPGLPQMCQQRGAFALDADSSRSLLHLIYASCDIQAAPVAFKPAMAILGSKPRQAEPAAGLNDVLNKACIS